MGLSLLPWRFSWLVQTNVSYLITNYPAPIFSVFFTWFLVNTRLILRNDIKKVIFKGAHERVLRHFWIWDKRSSDNIIFDSILPSGVNKTYLVKFPYWLIHYQIVDRWLLISCLYPLFKHACSKTQALPDQNLNPHSEDWAALMQ